ncbi:MAG: zf-HC2 domain-containing protein, partial [Eubacteriales bacterium]|nr:zf-HC2 domain-containing protein [Eubacteriales bacterium]
MDCEIIRDLFSEYIENQLDEENLKLFEKHMEECQECRNEFYKFEKMLIRIKAIKDIEPPKELK